FRLFYFENFKGCKIMKKTILSLAVSAFFMAGAVHAETNPYDASATLNVKGSVVQTIADACTVTTNKSSVALSDDVDNLINQGDDATAVETVQLNIVGENCASNIEAGTIAYKFTGVAANADDTALKNSDTSTTAAKGVGIGVFNDANKPMNINGQDYIVASPNGNTIGLQMVKLNGEDAQAGNITSSVTIEIERL
ncbi:fimbrial protein, partial [Cronobacter malonaticus]